MIKITSELNFLTEFELSRNGMIAEIINEFNVLRLAFSQKVELSNEYQEILDRIIVMPLRKLFFENQHTSILLKVCPDFRMPKLSGISYKGEDKLHIELAPYSTTDQSSWISVEDWGNQPIAYFDKRVADLPQAIPANTFQNIINKLKKEDKLVFSSLFDNCDVKYKGEINNVFIRKNPSDENANTQIYDIMDKAGYYKLTVYDFIKHLSDKRGAHIDPGIALLVKFINGNEATDITPIQCFAVQMIYAAKKQIPELVDYWPEMPELII